MEMKQVLDELMSAYTEAEEAERKMTALLGEDNVFSRITGRIGDSIRSMVIGTREVPEETEVSFIRTLCNRTMTGSDRAVALAEMAERIRSEDRLPPPRFLSDEERKKQEKTTGAYFFRKRNRQNEPSDYFSPASEKLKTIVRAREKELQACAGELCQVCGEYVDEKDGSCDGCKWLPVRRGMFQ